MPAELRSTQEIRPVRVTGAAALEASRAAVRAVPALPFDALRFLYASAVQAGWMRRSMLASRDVEIQLDALEKLALGPFARTV
jgi:hypothetical protein